MMSLRIVWLAILTATSCYSPDYAGARYKCDKSADCPEGFGCVKNTCRQGDAPGPDMSSRAPDLKGAPPDATDSACSTNKGAIISSDMAVHACKGNFGSKMGQTLCAQGYHPCGPTDGGSLGKIDIGKCNALGGFYMVYQNASVDNGTASCQKGMNKALAGCGGEQGVTTVGAGSCGLLTSTVRCEGSMDPWKCDMDADHIFDGTSHNSSANIGGVLCCNGTGE